METKGFTISDLEGRISDINSYYLLKAQENNDKDMVAHWSKILKKYQINLDYLRNSK